MGTHCAIVRKELSQMFRNRRTRVFLFVPPHVPAIIFGYAVNLDVDNLRMGWMDQDHTPQSHDLLADFQGSGRFLLRRPAANEGRSRMRSTAATCRCGARAARIWTRYPAGPAGHRARFWWTAPIPTPPRSLRPTPPRLVAALSRAWPTRSSSRA